MKYILPILLFSISVLAQAKDKVGIVLPLSGPVASMGEGLQNGVQNYFKEYPKCKNYVDVVYEDSQYDGKKTLSAFYKLKLDKDVKFQIVWGNTPSAVLAPIAEKSNYPVIAISMDNIGVDKEYLLTFGFPSSKTIEKILELFKEKDVRNPASLIIDIGNAVEISNKLKSKLNGNLEIITINSDENNFSPIISRLKKKQVDALVVVMFVDQALNFLRSAKTLRYDPIIIGGDNFAEANFQKNAYNLKSDLKYAGGGVSEEFIKKYYKQGFIFEQATGYSIAGIACDYFKKNSNFETKEFLKSLKNLDLSFSPIKELVYFESRERGKGFKCVPQIYNIFSNDGKL